MPILQQNALVTIYLKAFLLTITSINTSYATKPFRITCDKPKTEEFGVFLNIKSVASENNKISSHEFSRMKEILGLNEKRASVAITQISKDPIIVPKSEIASSTTTPAANNGLFAST